MSASQRMAVLGAGAWGTALAVHLARIGHPTRLWARSPKLASDLERCRENTAYLPGVELPEGLQPTHDLALAARCPLVLIVVPSHGFRGVLEQYLSALRPGSEPVLVSATKGIERESLLRMSEVCAQEAAAAVVSVQFAVLSGPSFAEELAQGFPTASVIAADESSLADELQESLSGANLRLYSSADVVGVELGGTVKNIIAIASGVVGGLGLGSNTRAALITRGLHEMTRLGVACGGEASTFSGLAGLGDLVLTCTSSQSRNYKLGESLASGATLADFEKGRSVAEGARNSRSILGLARRMDVEMPITEQMVSVLHEGKPAREALEQLMSRALKSEAGEIRTG